MRDISPQNNPSRRRGPARLATAWAAVAVLLATGCDEPNAYVPPPPPKVTVARPVQRSANRFLEETGTTEAIEYVEIRARVKGILEEVRFNPNDEVTEGDSLYLIDPREYVARVNQGKADVEIAQARFAEAEAKLRRGEQLVESRTMTREEFDERKAARDMSFAEIAARQASLEESELELSYTDVTSPVTGMVGKTLVYEGNLVGDTEATHLTTIVKYDPIYAVFSISERDLLQLMSRSDREGTGRPRGEEVKMFLQRANDDGFPFEGHLDFTDLAVDQGTGTYMIRGIFPNPNREIVPGLFVRVRVVVSDPEPALLLPEQALGYDQDGRYVLVVDDENVVQQRPVKTGLKQGELMVVLEGITGDDRVIVSGLQRARAGATVEPIESSIDAAEEVAQAPADAGATVPTTNESSAAAPEGPADGGSTQQESATP